MQIHTMTHYISFERAFFRRLIMECGNAISKEVVALLTSHRPDQFKTMIRKWKFNKKHTKREYAHIIRKEAGCEVSGPHKRTLFFIRGRPVKSAKIERYKADHPNMKHPRSSKNRMTNFQQTYSLRTISYTFKYRLCNRDLPVAIRATARLH